MSKIITSLQNPLIKNIALLSEKARERRQQGLFVAEGLIELRMALERRIGIAVPLTAVTEDLTLAILVERVSGVLFKDDADIATVDALIETHEPVAAS